MRVAVDRAREQIDELVDLVCEQSERVGLPCDGQPLAALISVDDLELLKQLEEDSHR